MASEIEIRSYKDLVVWQKAVALATLCYRATSPLPRSEAHGLTSQIRRSVTSIAANIAEGYGRDQTGYFVQFLKVAQGSTRELETHLIIANNVGFLPEIEAIVLANDCEEISKMLRAFIRSIEAIQKDES